jgi:hypothetical protein
MTDSSASTPAATPSGEAAPAGPDPGGAEREPGGIRPRHIALGTVILIVVVGIIFLALFFDIVRHWLAVHSGTSNESSVYYGFWSGFGADLGEATLISAVGIGVYTGVRKVNCHTKGCWRIGHHALNGTPYILCRHHHPNVPTGGATHKHILEQHRKFKEEQGRA